MLNRRKIPSLLSLGMDHGQDNKMTAHAWLMTGGYEIVPKQGNYVELVGFR